jgi:hypothetical protein
MSKVLDPIPIATAVPPKRKTKPNRKEVAALANLFVPNFSPDVSQFMA